VSLKQRAANDFDPAAEGGDGREHPEATGRVLDGDPGTYWYTETYRSFAKDGVGIVLDAEPGVTARQLRVRTETPRWRGQVLVSDGTRPPEDLADWTKAADVRARRRTVEVELDVEDAPRWYLLWITDLGDRESVRINELSLFR
jgi:hypothetical protein